MSILKTLNKKYPINSEVLSVDGYTYRIKSEWSEEVGYYGAWAKNKTKNSSIWILNTEIYEQSEQKS